MSIRVYAVHWSGARISLGPANNDDGSDCGFADETRIEVEGGEPVAAAPGPRITPAMVKYLKLRITSALKAHVRGTPAPRKIEFPKAKSVIADAIDTWAARTNNRRKP